ncbi:hypothetical protein P4193_25390 [Pseudomonas aeruginosa]|nr:hypothetical protein [Pseudomonas aeruginosa]
MNETLTSLIVPGVLWALIVFSVISWALLLIKGAQSVQQKSQNKQFQKAFWNAPDLLLPPNMPRNTPVRWHASPTPGSRP